MFDVRAALRAAGAVRRRAGKHLLVLLSIELSTLSLLTSVSLVPHAEPLVGPHLHVYVNEVKEVSTYYFTAFTYLQCL